MKSIAIIFHDADYFSGGTRSILDIIDYWHEKRIFNIIAIFPKKKGSAIEYLKQKNIITISEIYGTNSVPMKRNLYSFIRYFYKIILWFITNFYTKNKLKRKLNKYDIDLIYTNTSTPYIGALLKREMKIPHIWHFREFGEENNDFTRLWGNKYFYKILNNYTDQIIVISKILEKKIRKYTKLPIKVIYDDISSKYINPNKIKAFESKPINVLMVGALSEGKGQIQAIKAIEKLIIEKYSICLYIAGKGSEEKKLKKYVKRNNLGKNIYFLGLIKNINKLRSKMDIGVVCSKAEAFGRVTIEGMLSKMVMIGANTGSTPELIKDGITGFIYKWGIVDDLANKVRILYKDPKIMKNVSEIAFNEAKAFTVGNAAIKCQEIIYEVFTKFKNKKNLIL